MCDIEKIEREIDIEMDLAVEDYLNTTIQDASMGLEYDITSETELANYDLEKKTTERFLGEI